MTWKEFKIGLQRHIVWEESVLFPRFEHKTGTSVTASKAAPAIEKVLVKASGLNSFPSAFSIKNTGKKLTMVVAIPTVIAGAISMVAS